MKPTFITQFCKYRLLVLTFISCFATITNAQILLKTDFENSHVPLPPKGWVVSNTGNANWQGLRNIGGGGNALSGAKCMYLANSYYGDQSDAWLITPGIEFKEGKKYSITFYYKNQSYITNTLQVTFGNAATPASQTQVIWQNSFKSNLYTQAQINFTATASGINYIGIHCTTKFTQTYLYIDDMLIGQVPTFTPNATKITDVTTTSANAWWNKVEKGAQYEYGISDTLVPPATTSLTTGNTAALSTLVPAKRYYFYLRSINSDGRTSLWGTTEFSTAYTTENIPVLNCGELFSNEFVSTGGLYLNENCGQIYFGREFFHKFTPTNSGMYKLNINFVNTGQRMSFSYKDAALGAGPEGWTCIGSANDYGGSFSFGSLEAGKEYLIMEKAFASPGFYSGYSYEIDCYYPPPVNDNCQNATEIHPTIYLENCTGTAITTTGATPGDLIENRKVCGSYDNIYDDEVWVKFTATADAQLFRFTNMVYTDPVYPDPNPGIYLDIFSKPCDLTSNVDCGYIAVNPGESLDVYSYLLKKDSTYYIRLFTANQTTRASFNMCIMDLDVTKGNNNTCTQGLSYTVNKKTDNDNRKTWVPLTDESYKLIAAVNAAGNTLNSVSSSVYINSGPVRKDGDGKYYLDRNITIQPETQPGSLVVVKLYFTNAELEKLIAQPGSGVTSIDDINVTRNDDECSSQSGGGTAELIKPFERGDYGSGYKYVAIKTTKLSSFYLHGGNTALPPLLVNFTGNLKDNNVLLNWKTRQEVNTKNFIVEKSSDGKNFSQVGIVNAAG
ncbi:MAG TPA: choice-of-anchor J domain-containing protein, partial [Panacibacter sp.]|nr:choice-of-anchor J domain-containing protein [Panacibacter sp.]